MPHSTRIVTFATVGFATCVAVVWPLFVTGGAWVGPRAYILGQYKGRGQDQGVGKWHDQPPRIGDHITQGMVSGGLLMVLLDPCGRFDQSVEMHLWTRRYISAVTLQSGMQVIARPLVILHVEPGASALFAVTYIAGYVCYAISQALLAHVTVLRLRIVSSPQKANWVARLYKFGLGLLCLVLISGSISWLTRHSLLVVLSVVLLITFLITYMLFQCIVMQEFWRIASDAVAEAHHKAADKDVTRTATLARAMAVCLTASAATSIIHFFVTLVWVNWHNDFSIAWHWAYQFSVVFDVPFDAALAVVCAGLIGPTSDRIVDLETVGQLARTRRERLIHKKLVEAARATTGPAVMLAALFQGLDPDVLIGKAVERFRCISWDVLHENSEIILCGGTLDGQVASAELYNFSKPCRVGECDAFFSHSWHDDAHQKWEALTEWCTQFSRTNRRTPTLWLDKVCIDQTNIAYDLQCLPIFVASCNTLLVISGLTYTSRLWCCFELFVYVNMRMEDESRHLPVIITVGESESVRSQASNTWATFDVTMCQCYKEDDKRKMLELVEKYPGGVANFNTDIQTLGTSLLQFPIENQCLDASPLSAIELSWKLFGVTLAKPADSTIIAPSNAMVENRLDESPSGAFGETESVISI